jgi:iron complex outermembrane receptor protein
MMDAAEWRAVNQTLGNDIGIFNSHNSDTDWFGAMLRTGFSQNQSVSLSGGSPKSNYRASYTYLDRNGIARDNSMTRHNFRFQFQQRAINDRLRLGITGSATLTDMQMPFVDDYILAYNMPPVYPIYNADGSYFKDANSDYDQGNPVQNQDQNYKLSSTNDFYGAGDIQFDFTSNFNIKLHLYKSRLSYDYSQWENPDNGRGDDNNGSAQRKSNTTDRNLMEWTFNYDQTFGARDQHKLSAIAGYSWENNENQGYEARATNFAVSGMGANNLQSGNILKIGEVKSFKNEYRLISFFARAHYSYDERYMVTGTVRQDGSSKFGANHKWGLFPSLSAAWGLSQEEFMKDISWISDMKLRFGYGITGNQDGLQPYKSLELYEPSGTYYDNGRLVTAFKVAQNANPNLKWESTSMLNIGWDFSFFKGRVGGTIEWYQKQTSDMLYTYKVPTPTYVYDRIQANVGDMKNTGVELILNVDVIRQRDFTWNTSLNLSHNKNEITRLSSDLYTTDRIYTGDPWIRGGSDVTSHVIEEGRPVGQFFMLKCNGLTPDGKYIMEDVNEDGQITDDDRTYVGSAQPDLTFGWNNSFSWKRWDASFFIRGTIGNKVLNNPLAAYGNNTYISGANAMKNENLTKFRESSRISSYYLEDGSFARLDNLAIGYSFDTKKIGWLEKARLYVAAQNLFVITGYKGLDPEVELFRGETTDTDAGLSPGIEPRNYFPKSSSFTFGVNFTF